MGKKTVQLDETYIFPDRFMTLCSTERKTLEEWGHIFLVTRQTISNWQTGKSIPSIVELMRITEYFHVSADYLLGLSDTASPEVTARAAVEYTGLSEAAVEWLHIGLDDFEYNGIGISEERKKENLTNASELIQSKSFTEIVHRLSIVAEEAYRERILSILYSDYCDCCWLEEDDDFYFRSEADREIVKDNLIHLLMSEEPWENERMIDSVRRMDDTELAKDIISMLMRTRDSNELQHFYASKALTSYLDQLASDRYRKAEQRFAPK